MRVLTYHKSFQQRVYCYCFDMINELKKRIEEDQTELAFFQELLRQQNRCVVCHGTGEIRYYTNIDESTLEKCKACNGTGEASKDPLE